jgi:hypothetical protein
MTYYVRTVVTLKLGQNPGYYELMARLVPLMAKQGWQLVFGLQPFVGDLRELMHLWEVERFEDIQRALQWCYTDPVAQEVLAAMPELLHNEVFQIMTKTPYST